VLEARELVARVARRSLPRRLRHFQRPPQIEFGDVEGATQLALVCSDRPGLLAEVAQALRESRVRVHDARIATFGERVEDFFVLTDENDAVLTEATRHRLRARLLERLGAESP
jgi:[protein-PII] uridylyltransferase